MDKHKILENLDNLLQDSEECHPSWRNLEGLIKRIIEEYFKVNFTSCEIKTSEDEDCYFDAGIVIGLSAILKKLGVTGITALGHSSRGFVSVGVGEQKLCRE